MATITVLDSAGASQTIAKVASTGATAGANALPVVIATDDAILGALTETAPANDTASSGHNGRLQRIAQNVTANTVVATAMSAKLPASVGIKAAASSLSVTQATEDAARFPASLGSKADASSFPVTQSTEDKAIFAAANTKLDTLNTTLSATNTQLPVTPSGSIRLTITRPANATAYTAGDVIGAASAALTFATGMTSGQRIMVTSADLEYDVAALPSGMTTCRLYLYNVTPPSALADNAAWDLPSGDRASFLGYIDLGQLVDLGSSLFVQTDAINKQIQLSGSANLFGYLVTTAGFTPAGSSEVLQLRLHFVGL